MTIHTFTWKAAKATLAGLAIVAGLAACATSTETSSLGASPVVDTSNTDARCEGLAGTAIEAGAVEIAELVFAGETLVGGEMEGATISSNLCRVGLRLQPVPGSEIKVEVWLPEDWNGKLMGFGGAGFDGGLGPGGAPLFSNAVARGYTIVANDAGHKPGASIESWVHGQPEKVIDFSHRGNHLAAAAAKQIIEANYGEPAAHAYFFGCSGGGRDGLMLATRFPEDYDGIIAGAPARRYTAILTQLHWYTQAIHGPGGAPDLEPKLGLVHEAVLENCDALDGVEDGVLEDPRLCNFDPAVLRCKDVDATSCLTDAEISALKKIYHGPRLSSGESVISGPEPGSEGISDWIGWVMSDQGSVYGQEFYRWFVYDDPDWAIESFNLDRDYPEAIERVAPILNVEDSDLGNFTRNGGKLIIYQGWNDVAITPTESIEYYEAVQHRIGPLADQVRLFMVPGMGHCAGGAGATSFDMQPILERWVEHGEAPERIIAVKPDSGQPTWTHPLCVWPKTAHYKGSGSTRDAANFACESPR